MTTTKLFTGVAIAALLSGTALAQNVVNSDVPGGAANQTSVFFPLGITPAQGAGNPAVDAVNFFVGEFQPASPLAQPSGTIAISSVLNDNIFAATPIGHRVRVTVSLTNGGFTTASGASYIAFDDGVADGAAGNIADDESCDLTAGPVAGGGVGGTSVSFLSPAAAGAVGTAAEVDFRICGVSSPAVAPEVAATGQVGTFVIPVQRLNSNAPIGVTLTYTQVDSLGNPVAGAVTQSDTLNFATPANSWNATPGAAATAHGFNAPAAPLTATGAGILSAGTLGTVSTDFRTTADSNGAAAGGAAVGILDEAGNALAITDLLASAQVKITFPNGVGDVNGVAISGVAGACTGPVTNVFTCPVTAAEASALVGSAANGTITYTVAGGATPAVTPEQTVTAVLETTTQTNYTVGGFNGNLATIQHDDGLSTVSATNDALDWVRFGSGGTESNIRVRFANADEANRVTQVRVYFNNGNGVTAPVAPALPYVLIPEGAAGAGFQRQGATITFNSGALGAAAGATGNADITNIEFQYTEGATPATKFIGAPEAARQLVNRNPSSFVATPGLARDN